MLYNFNIYNKNRDILCCWDKCIRKQWAASFSSQITQKGEKKTVEKADDLKLLGKEERTSLKLFKELSKLIEKLVSKVFYVNKNIES